MFLFNNCDINFEDKGQGNVVVLVHGYQEDLTIWGDFSEKLAEKFRVINIDLPGHGRSGLLDSVHTMELMAEAVYALLVQLCISRAFVVGHSMGGYVALAFLKSYRSMVAGMCLFHSHPMADSHARRKSRDLEIRLLTEGKKNLLFQMGYPESFSKVKMQKLAHEVERCWQIAKNTSVEGMIAALEGMKQRQDHQAMLKETTVPILYIIGQQDSYIDSELMIRIAERSPNGEVLLLPAVGHMGFIEEKELCLDVLSSFIEQHL